MKPAPDLQVDALALWMEDRTKPEPATWRGHIEDPIPPGFDGSLNIKLAELACMYLGGSALERAEAKALWVAFFEDQLPGGRHEGLCIREQNSTYCLISYGAVLCIYLDSPFGHLENLAYRWLKAVTAPLGLCYEGKRPPKFEGRSDWLRVGPFVAIPGSRVISRARQKYRTDISFWFAWAVGMHYVVKWPKHHTTGSLMAKAIHENVSSIFPSNWGVQVAGMDPDTDPQEVIELLKDTRFMVPLHIGYDDAGHWYAYQTWDPFGTNPAGWAYSCHGWEVETLVLPDTKKASVGLTGKCWMAHTGKEIVASVVDGNKPPMAGKLDIHFEATSTVTIDNNGARVSGATAPPVEPPVEPPTPEPPPMSNCTESAMNNADRLNQMAADLRVNPSHQTVTKVAQQCDNIAAQLRLNCGGES